MLSGPALKSPADLTDLISRHVREKPEAIALVGADGRYSWRELEEKTSRLACHYVELGLQPGDAVASLMPNRAMLILHYLACFRAGLVAMPLNYRYTAVEINHALAQVRPAMMIAHAERSAEIDACSEVANLARGTYYCQSQDPNAERSFEALLEKDAAPVPMPRIDGTSASLVLFTSGSTGRPKGVTHSQNSFGFITVSFSKALAVSESDVLLAGSSASHMGSIKLSLSGLWSGARVVLAPAFDADTLLPILRDERPTVALVLPAALFALIRDPRITRQDFASFRLMMSGGDKLSAELETEFTDLSGLAIHEAYGMTETGTSHINPPFGPNKLGSVGRNNPGYSSSICNSQGLEVPVGEEGQHYLKSPCMMTGYWNDRQATDDVLTDGWLDTGDLMRADKDGYVWFCGRRKQIIIHDGSNINPQDVEEALMAHPALAYAGVVGVHDLVHGQNVLAFVSVREGHPAPEAQELVNFAREAVGYKAPEAVVFLDALPLTAVGKLDRPKLAAMASAMMAGKHS